jgi:hypothetical protein
MYTCKFRVNYWKREKKTNGERERERESNEEARVGGDNFNLQYYHTHT